MTSKPLPVRQAGQPVPVPETKAVAVPVMENRAVVVAIKGEGRDKSPPPNVLICQTPVYVRCEGMAMAPTRLSALQRRILAWLVAEDQRTRGMMAASHQDLVHAL